MFVKSHLLLVFSVFHCIDTVCKLPDWKVIQAHYETLKGAQWILQCKGVLLWQMETLFRGLQTGTLTRQDLVHYFSHLTLFQLQYLVMPTSVFHAMCDHVCVLHVHYKINVLIFYESCMPDNLTKYFCTVTVWWKLWCCLFNVHTCICR